MLADFREGPDRISDELLTESARSSAELQEVGATAFESFFPANVRGRLRESESALLYLRLDEQLLEIPWEIVFDGRDFLGHKHMLGRQFFTESAIENDRRAAAPGHGCRLLLVSDTVGDAAGAHSEMERLAVLSSKSGLVDITVVHGPIDKAELLSTIRSHDVVHFGGRCHVDVDEILDSGWSVRDGIVNRHDLAALPELPQLVFSELIDASGERDPADAGSFKSASYGISCGFLSAGIPNVIADCWLDRDTRDAMFAERFYSALLSGMPLGEALRQARDGIIAGHDAGGVSWARYTLYGDPGTIPIPLARKRSPSQLTLRPDKAAERRQLTVMFCDLVGATTLAEKMDPEDWRELVRRWQQACAGVIDEYEGYVAQYLGDGILVYFGFPVAHEDNAERAARAAMEILRMLPVINQQSNSLKTQSALQMRIGIHTGPVVVGQMGADESGEFIAMGATPNIAARLQENADRDSVLISDATYHLVHEHFDCEPRTHLELSGVSEPIDAYRIVSARHSQEVADTLTPFVGREAELEELRSLWQRAFRGNGQVVAVVGDPGIGKSRLMREFNRTDVEPAHHLITSRCSPYFENSSHYPLIETIRQLLRFERSDDSHSRLAKIENAMQRYNFDVLEAVPLLATLLSVPFTERYEESDLSAEGARQRLEEIVVGWMISEARARPIRYLFEDVQWIDPSSHSMLAQLIDRSHDVAMMICITYRPDAQVALALREDIRRVRLERLPHGNAKEMVRAVAGTRALSSDVVDELIIKTDGVPLFLEEYTLMVLEKAGLGDKSSHAFSTDTIPETLQDLLLERLDRLGEAKETAQLASTMGRTFRFDVIRSLSPLPDSILRKHLDQLVAAGLIFERGEVASDQYVFKHVMMRDAAYRTLLRAKRESVHRQIAQYLLDGDYFVDDEPGLLAYHLTEAKLLDEAVEAWIRAGRIQAAKSAHIEAINHLNRAIELVAQLPDTPTRAAKELTAQTALASCQIATRGYGAAEVERAYNRALELCKELEDRQRLIKVLLGLEAVYFMRGEFDTAQEFADQSLKLAERAEDSPRLTQAHWGLACIHFHRGNFRLSQDHMAESIRRYVPNPSESKRSAVQDAKIMCMCYTAWGQWELGYPQKAIETAYQAHGFRRFAGTPVQSGRSSGLRCGGPSVQTGNDSSRARLGRRCDGTVYQTEFPGVARHGARYPRSCDDATGRDRRRACRDASGHRPVGIHGRSGYPTVPILPNSRKAFS